VGCHLSKIKTAAFEDMLVIMAPMSTKYSIDQEAQFLGLFQRSGGLAFHPVDGMPVDT
jgi:hypothetical protein